MRALNSNVTTARAPVTFTFDGTPVEAVEGGSVAAALVSAGFLAQRGGRKDAAHGHFCGMGTCFECLVSIDGVQGLRACMARVRSNMEVSSQPYRARFEWAATAGQAPHADDAKLAEAARDVVVIGAGPAGLEAALAAKQAGADVLVIDERAQPGGQYFKQLATGYRTGNARAPDRQMEWGRNLIAKVRAAGVEFWSDSLVWGAFREADSGVRIGVQREGVASILWPRALIIATGATEHPWPVPGWTLPGVMTTGGLQTLLRSYRCAPPGPIVVAGNGPLNMQVAAELVAAGMDVACVVESGTPLSARGMGKGFMAALQSPLSMYRGVAYLWRLRRARVPVVYGHAVAAIRGTHGVEDVDIAPVRTDGSLGDARRVIPARAVGLGYGFLPQAEVSRLLGVKHVWVGAEFGWFAALREEDGRCDVDGVFVVGEAGGIGGANVAMAQGRQAGLAAARYCGCSGADGPGRTWNAYLARHRRFQKYLWSAFGSPLRSDAGITPDTIVCRCEDVCAAEIFAAAETTTDLGAVKRVTRAGMGRCQGRYCAATIRKLLATPQCQPDELGLAAPQNPLKPIAAGQLAVDKPEWKGHRRVAPRAFTSLRSDSVQPSAERAHHRADVVIIGAGIIGVSTALYLARSGMSVAVIDRKPPNSEASGGNAGSLHVQLMCFDYKAGVADTPAVHTLPLQLAGATLWGQLAKDLHADIEYRNAGGLMVAETPEQMAFLEQKAALERSLGINTQMLGAAGVKKLTSRLSETIIGGAWCDAEGKVNPLVATGALASAARAAGARFFIGKSVCGVRRDAELWTVETDHGTFESARIVNAAGSWAASIAALAGIAVPVHGAPLQVLVTEPVEDTTELLLQHAAYHLTMKQAHNGNFLIGGGRPAGVSEPYGHPRPLLDSIEGNLQVAVRVMPGLAGIQILRSWAAMNIDIDGAPILGEVAGQPGFFNAVTSSGYTMGPLIGQITAELVRDGRSTRPIGQFTLDRFKA